MFKKETPEIKIALALNAMLSEIKAEERDHRGTSNRPKYVAAQNTIESLGAAAVDPMLTHLEELKAAEKDSPEFWLASDVIKLLGDIGDERAVFHYRGTAASVHHRSRCPSAFGRRDEGFAGCVHI